MRLLWQPGWGVVPTLCRRPRSRAADPTRSRGRKRPGHLRLQRRGSIHHFGPEVPQPPRHGRSAGAFPRRTGARRCHIDHLDPHQSRSATSSRFRPGGAAGAPGVERVPHPGSANDSPSTGSSPNRGKSRTSSGRAKLHEPRLGRQRAHRVGRRRHHDRIDGPERRRGTAFRRR